MLELKRIRKERDQMVDALKKRSDSIDFSTMLDEAINLDSQRKEIQLELDQLNENAKKFANEIGNLFKNGEIEKANARKESVREMKSRMKELETLARENKEEIQSILFSIPNIPNEKVPAGMTEEDNEVFLDWQNAMPNLPDNALPHWELAEKYNVIDFQLGAKITGSGFPLYVGKGAQLQRALISFFLEEAGKAGYTEYMAPLVVNEDSARGTGQLPDKEGLMYHCQVDDLYLIPTAEVPLTNIFRDVILKEGEFPIRICGYTPCFRREAGSYGAHVKGLNRLHQFDKVEIVQIRTVDDSYRALDEMLDHVKGLLDKLELPYRILRLCGGDLGFTSAITYDFEVYSAAQKRWLEVSSVSNFETFQSNRLKLRYRDAENKRILAHTLNGSALALPRILAALLENNQVEGGINIPEVLQKFTGFKKI